MQPEIVQRDAFQVVGMRYAGKNENNEIPALWGQFFHRAEEIRNVTAHEAYGVCQMVPDLEPGAFEYVAGLPVTSVDGVPEGMVAREIPAQTYAAFMVPCLADIMKTHDHINREWFPTSGYEHACGPDFELYPAEFMPGANETFYIYIPVKKA
ncbi:MAG TPA: GyrI-like domain-containing protein [Armatimonadota bacterium]|jgi:AraC family transcriptional regulator